MRIFTWKKGTHPKYPVENPLNSRHVGDLITTDDPASPAEKIPPLMGPPLKMNTSVGTRPRHSELFILDPRIRYIIIMIYGRVLN